MLSRSTRVELGCRFAIRALLLKEDTLLQVRNFFSCILSLRSVKFAKAIINAIFLGLNLALALELHNWYHLVNNRV